MRTAFNHATKMNCNSLSNINLHTKQKMAQEIKTGIQFHKKTFRQISDKYGVYVGFLEQMTSFSNTAKIAVSFLEAKLKTYKAKFPACKRVQPSLVQFHVIRRCVQPILRTALTDTYKN